MVCDGLLRSLSRAIGLAVGGLLLAGVFLHPLQAATVGADAVVLVNSSSARYLDFQHYVQPYLDNFGIPYTALDIANGGVGTNLASHALIVIGHSELDTNNVFLDAAAQASLLLAVSNGTGLVSFDGALSASGAPRYPFMQEIFGFSYGAPAAGTSVILPATESSSQMHYITALHPAGDVITLRAGMNVPGLTASSNITVVAQSGSRPLVAVARYGQGRAVHWSSYEWMSTSVLGPVDGLDDLVWRSLTWAARKPFVMRGLPNFVTLRMDDAGGPFWWVHIANEMGFKPWLGLSLSQVDEANTADLRYLTTNGLATASIHTFNCCNTFFYYDDATGAPWPDNVISNHFYIGTQWHASHGIPISKVVIAHYSEIGPNAFAGLKAWGVEFMNLIYPPGYSWSDSPPWLVAGPYRLYETPRVATTLLYPVAYADFFSVPGHPEFDGQFFCCVTELSDDSPCNEWCPSNNDVAGSIARGTRQVKRAFDSMVHAALYTHEWNLIPIPQSGNQVPITTNNWRAILQGITNNLAAYNPIFVTYDYAAQYSRATRTSRLLAADYDPASGQVTATLSGSTDLDTQVLVFLGQDNAITSTPGTVPAFSGLTTEPVALLPPLRLSVAVAAPNSIVITWPNLVPGVILQQSVASNATNWSDVTNSPVVVDEQVEVLIPNPTTGSLYRLVQP